jgi:hypothetical protein
MFSKELLLFTSEKAGASRKPAAIYHVDFLEILMLF